MTVGSGREAGYLPRTPREAGLFARLSNLVFVLSMLNCAGCGSTLAPSAFSKAQRKRKDARRCNNCVAAATQPASSSATRYEAGACRICFGETTEPQLVAPCNCISDRRLVHPQCLIHWQQQGHLKECEVCHTPWTFGLTADAVPVSREVAESMLAACQTAIRDDDRASLRRRLTPHLISTSGVAMLQLCARHARPGPMQELLKGGADGEAAVRELLGEGAFAAAKALIQTADLSLPFEDMLDGGEHIFQADVGCPGNTSRVLERVVHGDADMVRIFHAYGIDLNAARHRFSEHQLSPLMIAIMYAPEEVPGRPQSGRLPVVRALIECGADVDYCTDRSTALISAIMKDDVHSTVALLHARAATSIQPACIVNKARWRLASAAYSDNSKCSTELLQAVVSYQLTGLTQHASETFGDFDAVRRKDPAHRTQHSPELALGCVQEDFAEAKGGAELRALGNEFVRLKDWEKATMCYSLALVAGHVPGRDVEADPEPHKVLCNRSLAHLRLAQHHAIAEAQEKGEVEAPALLEARMAALRSHVVALPPLPDFMEGLGQEAFLGQVLMPEQVARGFRRSQMYRALAFSDAHRAIELAPAPWAKAHARKAEAAYEIGVHCWARGDPHGTTAMSRCLSNAYRIAASLEPSGGFVAAGMKGEANLHTPMPPLEGDDDDDDGPVARLLDMVNAMAKAGVSKDELAMHGFVLPPKAELRQMEDAGIEALEAQLNDVIEGNPSFSEKLKTSNRRRQQGGTDIPATREVAATVPFGESDDRWALSYSTVGYTAGETPFWAITIVDNTPPPHRHADKMVGSGVHHGVGPPTLEEVEDTLLRAIQYPCEGAGPPRRPKYLVLAWRLREMYESLKSLASSLDIDVHLEDYELAVAIAAAHGTDIEGRNHGPGCAK